MASAKVRTCQDRVYVSEVRPLPDPCPPSAGPGRHHRHLGPTRKGMAWVGALQVCLTFQAGLGMRTMSRTRTAFGHEGELGRNAVRRWGILLSIPPLPNLHRRAQSTPSLSGLIGLGAFLEGDRLGIPPTPNSNCYQQLPPSRSWALLPASGCTQLN